MPTAPSNNSQPREAFSLWGPFGRAASLTSAGALTGILIEFISLCIAVRTLPKAEVGAFAIFLVIARVAQLISDGGMRQALVQRLAANSGDPSKAFQTALAIETLASIAVAVGIKLVGNSFKAALFTIPHYALYLIAYVLFQSWHQVLSGTLQGLRLYRAFIIGELSRSVTRLVLLYVLLLRFGAGLEGLIIASVLAPAIAAMVQLLLVPFTLSRFDVDLPTARQLVRAAYPLGGSSLLGIVSDRASRVVLIASHGPVAVAMLEIASKISDASIQCYMGFQSAFFPTIARLLARKDKRPAERALNETVGLVAGAVVLISLAVTMQRDFIIRRLFSASYLDTSWAFALLFSTLAIALTNNLLHTTMIASGDTKVAFVASLFQTAVSVALCVVWIPRYGCMGAVYTYIASNCAVNPFLVYRLRRLHIRVGVVRFVVPCCVLALVDALSVQHRGAAWLVCAAALTAAAIGLYFWRRSTGLASNRQNAADLGPIDLRGARGTGRLKILVVTERYPPYHDGGYEIACQRTVDMLRSRGHCVTVLTSRYGLFDARPADGIYRVMHRLVPLPNFKMEPWYVFRQVVRAVGLRLNVRISRDLCRRIQPDIVFAWQTDGIGLATVADVNFPNCPVVHRLDDITLALLLERLYHEQNAVCTRARHLLYGVPKQAMPFRHMIAVSTFLAQRYVKAGIQPGAITVIHNGTPEMSVVETVDDVCSGPEIRLLVAGRVCFDKGVHVAIQALAQLQGTGARQFTLDVVGPVDDSYVQSLEALSESLGIAARVRICGPMPPDSMLRLYDAYDIVLFPSLVWEGFGLTIIEAMARGRPVVAVNRGGPCDIIADRTNGMLVAPDDPAALAEAVQLLISNSALRTSVQQAALSSVRQHFTIEHTVARLETYLLTLRVACDSMPSAA
jgi:glycosyltransferase involved in cell wall biosynthesis/O-antigen/teichoic acid export membrane protein